MRILGAGAGTALRFLIHFMPVAQRSIQADGLTLFYIRYWHPVFAAWRESRKAVRVRYRPADLSCVFVSTDGRSYGAASYADVRRPAITLWKQRAAVKALRALGEPKTSEQLLFMAIAQQHQLVERARRETQRARRKDKTQSISGASAPVPIRSSWPSAGMTAPIADVDYSQPVDPFPVEIW